MHNQIKVLNIKLDPLPKNEIKCTLAGFLVKNAHIICTPNTEIIMLAQKDQKLSDILNNVSDLNIVDGIGLVWAAKYLQTKSPENQFVRFIYLFTIWLLSIIFMPLYSRFGNRPIKERMPGSDFIWDLSKFAAENNLKVFFLGGEPTVAERCALKLQTDIVNLRVAGVHSGPSDEVEDIISTIRKSKADILYVGYGAPKQEKWLAANLRNTGCMIGMGVGGTFDFIAGTKPRAPRWIQKLGFEWLYRLAIEPKRIFRQIAIPKFMIKILVGKLKEKND